MTELSTLVSKSSGIEQNFEHHVSSEGSIIVVSNNPESFIHVFGLTASRKFVFEGKELRDVQFLANYQPSDAPAVRIPNPIKEPARYALVAIRTASMDPTPLGDLTDLASIAEQTFTQKGYYLWNLRPPSSSSQSLEAEYTSLSFLIVDRLSLRDDQGTIHIERFPSVGQQRNTVVLREGLRGPEGYVYQSYLNISEQYNNAWILYKSCADLGPYLTKRFTHRELLKRVYRKPFAHHDWTSRYGDRVRAINRLFRGRKFIDFTLHYQGLHLEDGVWKSREQSYTSEYGPLEFIRIDKKLVILEGQ